MKPSKQFVGQILTLFARIRTVGSAQKFLLTFASLLIVIGVAFLFAPIRMPACWVLKK